jgi:phage I-like protein
MQPAALSLAPVLMAAQSADAQSVPDWVHLLPAKTGAIRTVDQRGPFHVSAPDEVIAASFTDADRLPIDENHATDLAAPNGLPAPARGWIVEMEARADGIWGRVEWTEAGAALVKDRAYRAISPVILHDDKKRVLRVLRASLVNRPNLKGLATLNSEEPSVNFIAKLAEALGLEKTATEDAVMGAVGKLKSGTGEVALQSALTEIGTALGVAGEKDAILAAAKAAKDAKPAEITALQAELVKVAGQLSELQSNAAKGVATAYIDGEIAKGRVGVKPLRDHYIARHMADAAAVEKEIAALPVVGPSGTSIEPPAPRDGEVALNAAQRDAARLLGIDPKKYAETLKAEKEEAL